MQGDRISLVNDQIVELIGRLRMDPQCLETVWICIAAFNASPIIIQSPAELAGCRITIACATPSTPCFLGRAVNWLSDYARSVVAPTTVTIKGDWKPVVFIFTGSRPTDIEEFTTSFPRLRKACGEVAIAVTSADLAEYYANLINNPRHMTHVIDLSLAIPDQLAWPVVRPWVS